MHEVGDVKRKPERYGFSDIKDPDFLYIGYEKAASTFLQHYFSEHPDIYLDNWIANYALFPHLHHDNFYSSTDILEVKEAKVLITQEERLCESVLFDTIIRWRNIRWNQDKVATLLEQVSVSPRLMANRWKSLYPRVKIIIVIRDQVAWLGSLYRYSVSELPKGKRSFGDFCATPRGAIVLRAGLYDITIQAYFDVFGADQVKVLRYEDLASNHDGFMDELSRYIGVERIRIVNKPLNVGRSAAAALLRSKFPYFDDIPPVIKNVGRRVLATLGERNRSGLSRAEEQFIRNFYKLSNLQTEKILSGECK